ncbi:hypothetical protein RJ641_003935 [Dillenia turbinata]|uniref:Uncharacterized protein n=1 Tax=Dillenia turbinata TaxID=194707 RepID=A0AAN8VH60_9MAGN
MGEIELLLIGVMSILVVAFGILFGFIWVWMLSKKERAVKRYTEVKKQVEPEASKLMLLQFCRHQTYYFPWRSSIYNLRMKWISCP